MPCSYMPGRQEDIKTPLLRKLFMKLSAILGLIVGLITTVGSALVLYVPSINEMIFSGTPPQFLSDDVFIKNLKVGMGAGVGLIIMIFALGAFKEKK